jgi:hypothetical protein
MPRHRGRRLGAGLCAAFATLLEVLAAAVHLQDVGVDG